MGKESDDPDYSPRNEILKTRSALKISDPADLRRRTQEALKISLKYTELLVNRMNCETNTTSSATETTGSNLTSSDETAACDKASLDQQQKTESKLESSSVHIGGIKIKNWPPSLLAETELRDYQLEGLRWLMVLDSNGANGILADEMGLGKTIQMISMFSLLIENNVGSEGPLLVISPLSTLQNWASEFAKFSPKIPVILYHGTKSERELLRKGINKLYEVEGHLTYPVVITSFEIPLRDRSLRGINWRYIVIDEGHRLKNHRCLLIQELRMYRTVTCVLLTGTPLQNNLTELWSLLNFILPDIVQDRELFESWLDTSNLESSEGSEKLILAEEKDQILTTLHKILKPFILRRVKEDVGVDIPPKKEIVVYAPLTELQKALYSYVMDGRINALQGKMLPQDPVAIEKALRQGHQLSDATLTSVIKTRRRKRNSTRLVNRKRLRTGLVSNDFREKTICHESSDEDVPSPEMIMLKKFYGPDEEFLTRLKTNNHVMALRKICDHPYLVSFPVIPGTRFPKFDENVIERSGKLQLLDAILKRLKKNGHKVLLFSNFVEMLDILESYLQIRNYGFVRLDGTYKLNDRQDSINKFSFEEDVFVFLISTRAGGLGINLTAADTVIIFDSDWNPQVDVQAQDRCHRIGQTKPVAVYRLIVAGTVDEQIIKRADSKKQLEKLVITGGKFQSLNQQHTVDLEELREILNLNDNKVVFDSGMVYSEPELDDLCNREKLFPTAV